MRSEKNVRMSKTKLKYTVFSFVVFYTNIGQNKISKSGNKRVRK